MLTEEHDGGVSHSTYECSLLSLPKIDNTVRLRNYPNKNRHGQEFDLVFQLQPRITQEVFSGLFISKS